LVKKKKAPEWIIVVAYYAVGFGVIIGAMALLQYHSSMH